MYGPISSKGKMMFFFCGRKKMMVLVAVIHSQLKGWILKDVCINDAVINFNGIRIVRGCNINGFEGP